MPSRQDLHSTLAQARQELQAAQSRVAELEAQIFAGQPNHIAVEISENAYYHLLDAMPAGCQIIGFDWHYHYINDTATHHERRTKQAFRGHTIMELHPGIEKTAVFAILQRCMRDRSVERIEHEVSYPEGDSAWFELLVQPVPEGIFILSLDITARKRTEVTLPGSEQQLRLFMEHAPAALAMLDQEMRYLLVSRRWLTDYRLHEANVIGRSHYELFPDLPARWKEIHQRCLAGAVESSEADPFPRADGSLDWVRWEIHPWRKLDGTIGGILILSEVITERKRAEEQIRKLHRTLGVLSDINQSIVRIRHLPALFEKACAIAVEKGAFRVAWLGLFDAISGRIDPVAHAGIADTDLEKLISTLTSSPLISALRAGARLIGNDLQNDPGWRFWRDEAVRLGCGATAVLPLIVAGELRGIFNLYAGETDFFDEPEMQLVNEMAGDIAFAIEVAEQDKQRAKAEATVKRYVERMEILHQIDTGIINANSAKEIVATALQHIRQLIPCQRANVGLLDSAQGEAVIFAVDYDSDTALGPGLRIPIAQDFFDGYDARHVKVIPDLRVWQATNPRFKQAVKEGLLCGINVLLMDRDQPIGTLGLFANVPDFFTAEHQEILIEIGNQLAIAINQLHLHEALAHYAKTQAEERQFLATILDAFPANCAVLNAEGVIIRVNAPWKQFAAENNGCSETYYLGTNYLSVCEQVVGLTADAAASVAAGIRAVIAGEEAAFYFDYPCHSSTTERWFILRVTPFAEPAPRRVLVAHLDNTARKKAEDAERNQRVLAEALRNSLAALATLHNVEAVMQQILAQSAAVIPSEAGTIILFEGNKGRVAYARGFSPEAEDFFKHNPFSLDGGLYPTGYGNNDSYLVVDTRAESRWIAYPVTDWIRSSMGGSILLHGKPIGLLVADSATPHQFQQKDIDHFRLFARYAALALESAQLVDQLEQKVAERTADLQTALVRVEAILNNSPDAILLIASDLTIQQANASFNSLFGAEGDEDLGQSFLTLFHPDDANKMGNLSQIAATQPNEKSIEVRAIRKDGTTFDAELTTRVIQGDGLVCNIRDITERKAYERQLRYHAALQENVSDAVIVTDMAFRIQTWNEAAVRTYGWTAEEAIGKVAPDFLQIRFPLPLNPEAELKRFNEDSSLQQETIQQRKDGTDICILGSATRLEDAQGVPVGVIAVNRDITERKAQERQLRYHASIQESVSDAVIATDMAFRIQSWNCAAESIYGWSAAEAIGKSINEILQTTYASAEEGEHILRDFFERDAWQGEVIQRHRDGRIIYVHASVNLFKDETGQPFGVVSVNRDITERKRAAEALQQSAAEIHDLYNNAPCGYHSIDQDGLIIQINDTELRWLDYTRDEVVGKLKITEICTPESLAIYQKLRPALIKQGWFNNVEVELIRKDGSIIHILLNATAIYDDDGQFLRSRATLFDVTELQQAQRALVEREARYRLLAENISDMIMTFSLDRIITYMSPSCERLLGYLPEEVEGRSHSEYIHPEDYPQVIERTRQAVAANASFYTNQFRLRHKAGHYIWYEVRTRLVFNDTSDNVVQFISILRDITERKRADDALRESEERFRRAIIDAPFPIMIHADDGAVLHISNAWAEISGYTHTEIPTMTDWIEKAYRETSRTVRPMIEKVYTLTKPRRGGEFRIWTKSGEERIWDFISAPLTVLPDGRRMVSSMAMDITERKRAEEALHNKMEEERQFQIYLKTLHEIVIELTGITQLDTFYKRAVELGREQLGFERLAMFLYDERDDSAVGTYGTDSHGKLVDERGMCFTPDPDGVMQRSFARVERFYFKEGTTLYDNQVPVGHGWNAAAVLWNGTRNLGWFVADNLLSHEPASKPLLDIMGLYALSVGTLLAQKQTQLALKESEALYRLLAENISDLITRSTLTSECRYISPSVQLILGYAPEELIGQQTFDLVHPDDQPIIAEAFASDLERYNLILPHQYRIKHKDGHYIWLETVGKPIFRTDATEVCELITSSRDITERKLAETALRESEEKFRLLLDAAPVATIISDQTGQISLVNVQAEKLFGYRRDALIGRMVEILVPDYARDSHVHNRIAYVAAPRVRPMGLGMELYARHKDGSNIPVEIELSYVATRNGTMVMSFILDITERKRAAAELEQQRSFLRNVIDVSPNMIFVKDYAGRFVLANPSIAAMYNTTVDELVGKTDADFNPTRKEVDDYLAADRLVITSSERLFIEESITHPAGKVHWLQTTKVPIVSADGKAKHVLGVLMDITERKEAEEALRASEEKYRSLVETMRGSLAVFDTEYHVTFVNDRFCELLGYSSEEILGKHPTHFIDAAHISLVQSHLERRQHTESTSYEVPLRHKDGHQIHVLLSGSPLLDKQGNYSGSLVVATDISLQKQAEETLRMALAKEKELGDLKTRFVSMASHEFRTPLATILALVETVSTYRNKLSEAQIEQRYDKIKAQIGHLKNIMEDVLMLSRMQARRVEFNPVMLDLGALARDILDEFQNQPAIQHRLEYTASEGMPEVLLDHKLMRQLLSNLVSNAIKYSPKGTVVRIHLAYTDCEIILTVRDEGIGIPEADLPHLFEPFHRATNVGTISGTGLGLVIAREAVEWHGGTITVESRLGVGTTFTIHIPISAGEGQ